MVNTKIEFTVTKGDIIVCIDKLFYHADDMASIAEYEKSVHLSFAEYNLTEKSKWRLIGEVVLPIAEVGNFQDMLSKIQKTYRLENPNKSTIIGD